MNRRNLFAERLEERSLLAGNVTGFLSDYYNQSKPSDVNADGMVAPLDALLVINKLNADGGGVLPQGGAGEAGRLYVDVSNDGIAAPLDALLVINTLNAEGEEPLQAADVARYQIRLLQPGTNTLISGLSGANNVTGTVSIGQQMDLQIQVEDIRAPDSPAAQNARGVFGAYLDVLTTALGGAGFTVAVPEIQTLTVNSIPASNNFTLTFNGQTTGDIALADVDGNPLPAATVRADISAKLEALSSIGTGNVLVIANSASSFSVRFVGNKYNINQPLMTSNAGANIDITELNPSDPLAFAEAFRSVPIPGVGGTGSNYQTLLTAAQTTDRLDDVGAVNLLTDGTTPGTGLKEVARVRLIAGNVGGSLTFTPDFADLQAGLHDTTVYTSPGANPVARGTINTLPGRVGPSVTDASHFASDDLLIYPDTIKNQLVGSKIEFLNGPASVLENDPQNPGGPQIKPVRTITAFDPATGAITVDAPFPGTPLLQGSGGAVEDNAFSITLTTPTFIDLVGANPVAVTVNVVTGPIDAVNDNDTTAEDTAKTINVASNDTTQPAGGTVVVTAVGSGANGAQHGTLTFSGGNVTYTPAKDFNGTDSFTYTAKNNTADPTGANPDTATVTVTVTPVNDVPTITAPAAQNVNEGGGTKTVTVAGIGPGGGADEASQTVTVTATSSNPAVASTTSPLDGSNQLTLTGGAAGTATITLTAVDTGSPAATTTVTFNVTVAAVNDPPDVTAPASATTDIDVDLTFSAANGNKIAVTDPDAGSGTIQVTITSSNGTIVGGSGSSRTLTGTLASIQSTLDSGITYHPPAGFDGAVTLTVVANDNGNTGTGGPQTDTATVAITVQPAVPKPIADNDTFSGATEDTVFNQAAPGVLDGDTDSLNRLPLTAVGASMPANFGTVTLNPDGSFNYNPAKDFNGPASFTYRAQASDGTQSNPATVTINVAAVNDAPTANPDTAQIIKLDVDPVAFAKQPIDVLANDTDVDSPLSSLVVGTLGSGASGPQHGTIEKSADGKKVLYTPTLGFEGADSFTYTASDGSAESTAALVSVNVVNFAPKDVKGQVVLNNGNGTYTPLSNIEVRISGKDFNGQDLATVLPVGDPSNNTSSAITVNYLRTRTDSQGNYVFAGLAPPQTSYKLTEVQPALFVDGAEVNSTNSPLATVTSVNSPPALRKDEFTLAWPITDQNLLTGLRFIEDGIDFSQLGDVTTAEQTAKAGPNGFWLAADISGNTLWSFSLPGGGWANATSLKLLFDPANLATAQLNVTGLATANGVQSILIHQNPANNLETNYPAGSNVTTPTYVGPRFRVYGNLGTGPLLFRIDGSAADFGLAAPLLTANFSAGGEGEGLADRGYAGAADKLFASSEWA